jgi:SAM-dependent methyltransferase
MLVGWLKDILTHPLARGLDPDDPATLSITKRIIREKSFLIQIYQKWYKTIAATLPPGNGPVLELGSGAGFLQDYIPDLITSDLLATPDLTIVMDGQVLPIRHAALRAIVMTEVLHHLPRPRLFFSEAARCVRPGGIMVMIEPWVSQWSRLIYGRLHHEPFEPDTREWEFPPRGPLSGANEALPWILFHRDCARFQAEFPEWRIARIEPMMPVSYLLAGGLSMRALAPGGLFKIVRSTERLLQPWMDRLAMFALIVLERVKPM